VAFGAAVGPTSGNLGGWVASAVVAVATIVLLVGLALLPFLNPIWVGLGQERAEADAWTGWPMATVHEVTNAVLVDLVLGPPDFDQVVDGEPVFNEREVGHLQDVRTVLVGFAVVVAAAAAAIVVVWRVAGSAPTWRGVRLGATTLIAGVVALGILSVVAFEAVFEVFHRIFFASGTYAFDPETERLVQLFPMQFWFETSIALGVVLIVLGALALVVAERRGRRAAAAVPPVTARDALASDR
jgi:integral membrane protein (TIGR01906 family)